MPEARKCITSWVAALNIGVQAPVDGEPQTLKLPHPASRLLLIGERELPLVGMGLRLEGRALLLAFAGDDGSKEFVIRVELASEVRAVELAVTLKALRAECDNGAGIADWGERPADHLQRPSPPPPAE